MKLESLMNKARLTASNLSQILASWDEAPAALKRKVRSQIKSGDVGRGAAAADVIASFVRVEPNAVGSLPVSELSQDMQTSLLKDRHIDASAKMKLIARLSTADDVALQAVANFLKSNGGVTARVLKRLVALAEAQGNTRALRIFNSLGGEATTRTTRTARQAKEGKVDTRRGADTATSTTRTARAADKPTRQPRGEKAPAANAKALAKLVAQIDAACDGEAAEVKAVRMAAVDALSTAAKMKEFAQASGARLVDLRKAKRMLAEATKVSEVREALKLMRSVEPTEADGAVTVEALLAETRTPARRRVAKDLIARSVKMDAKTKRLVNAVATASGAKASREAFAALQAHFGVAEEKPARQPRGGRTAAKKAERTNKAASADVKTLAGVVAELMEVSQETDLSEARKKVRGLVDKFEDALASVHPAPKGVLLKSLKSLREVFDSIVSATAKSQVRSGLEQLVEALDNFVAQDTKHSGSPRLMPLSEMDSLDEDTDLDDADELPDDEADDEADNSAFIQLGADLDAVDGDAAAQRKLAREFVADEHDAGEYAETVQALADSKSKTEIAQLAAELIEAAADVAGSSAKKQQGDTDLDDGDTDLDDADLEDEDGDTDLDDSELDSTPVSVILKAAQAIVDADSPKDSHKLAKQFVTDFEDVDEEIFEAVNKVAGATKISQIVAACEDLSEVLAEFSGEADDEVLSDLDEEDEIDFYGEIDTLVTEELEPKEVRAIARKLIKFAEENEDESFQPDVDVMDCLSIIAESSTSKDVQAGIALLADAVQTLALDAESDDSNLDDDEDDLEDDGIAKTRSLEAAGLKKARSLAEAADDLLSGDDDEDFSDDDLNVGTAAITGRRRAV